MRPGVHTLLPVLLLATLVPGEAGKSNCLKDDAFFAVEAGCAQTLDSWDSLGTIPGVSVDIANRKPSPDGTAINFNPQNSKPPAKVDIDIGIRSYPRLTIAVWFKALSTDFNRGWIIGSDQSGYDRGIELFDNRFGGVGGCYGHAYKSELGYPEAGKWYQVVVTYENGNPKSGVFLQTIGGELQRQSHMANNDGLSRGYFTINNYNDNAGDSSHSADVDIHSIRMYDRILMADEVSALYEHGVEQLVGRPPEGSVECTFTLGDEVQDLYYNGLNIKSTLVGDPAHASKPLTFRYDPVPGGVLAMSGRKFAPGGPGDDGTVHEVGGLRVKCAGVNTDVWGWQVLGADSPAAVAPAWYSNTFDAATWPAAAKDTQGAAKDKWQSGYECLEYTGSSIQGTLEECLEHCSSHTYMDFKARDDSTAGKHYCICSDACTLSEYPAYDVYKALTKDVWGTVEKRGSGYAYFRAVPWPAEPVQCQLAEQGKQVEEVYYNGRRLKVLREHGEDRDGDGDLESPPSFRFTPLPGAVLALTGEVRWVAVACSDGSSSSTEWKAGGGVSAGSVPEGWFRNAFDDSAWQAPRVVRWPEGELEADGVGGAAALTAGQPFSFFRAVPRPAAAVTCQLAVDDSLVHVYYGGVSLKDNVTGDLHDWQQVKTFTYTPVPGAVLAISGRDEKRGEEDAWERAGGNARSGLVLACSDGFVSAAAAPWRAVGSRTLAAVPKAWLSNDYDDSAWRTPAVSTSSVHLAQLGTGGPAVTKENRIWAGDVYSFFRTVPYPGEAAGCKDSSKGTVDKLNSEVSKWEAAFEALQHRQEKPVREQGSPVTPAPTVGAPPARVKPGWVTCEMTVDNEVLDVFYNGRNLTRVLAPPSGLANWKVAKSFKFTPMPGAVLAISGRDYESGKQRNAALVLICSNGFTSSVEGWKVRSSVTYHSLPANWYTNGFDDSQWAAPVPSTSGAYLLSHPDDKQEPSDKIWGDNVYSFFRTVPLPAMPDPAAGGGGEPEAGGAARSRHYVVHEGGCADAAGGDVDAGEGAQGTMPRWQCEELCDKDPHCRAYQYNGQDPGGNCLSHSSEQVRGGTNQAGDHGRCYMKAPGFCTAVDNVQCVFPFTYGGVQYDKCSRADEAAPWCSGAAHYTDDAEWGFCADDCENKGYRADPPREPPQEVACTAVNGVACVFPFVWNGVEYDKCTTVDNGDEPWCSGDKYTAQEWGACGDDCDDKGYLTEEEWSAEGLWTLSLEGDDYMEDWGVTAVEGSQGDRFRLGSRASTDCQFLKQTPQVLTLEHSHDGGKTWAVEQELSCADQKVRIVSRTFVDRAAALPPAVRPMAPPPAAASAPAPAPTSGGRGSGAVVALLVVILLCVLVLMAMMGVLLHAYRRGDGTLGSWGLGSYGLLNSGEGL